MSYYVTIDIALYYILWRKSVKFETESSRIGEDETFHFPPVKKGLRTYIQ